MGDKTKWLYTAGLAGIIAASGCGGSTEPSPQQQSRTEQQPKSNTAEKPAEATDEAVKSKSLEKITLAYEKWAEEKEKLSGRSYAAPSYDLALSLISNLEYTLKDVEHFIAESPKYIQTSELRENISFGDIGIYISALINNIIKEDETFNINFASVEEKMRPRQRELLGKKISGERISLGEKIRFIGYKLSKGTIKADVLGGYAGAFMTGGKFIAESMWYNTGHGMEGGLIEAKEMGTDTGYEMQGGTIKAETIGRAGTNMKGGIIEAETIGSAGSKMEGGIIKAETIGSAGTNMEGGIIEAETIGSAGSIMKGGLIRAKRIGGQSIGVSSIGGRIEAEEIEDLEYTLSNIPDNSRIEIYLKGVKVWPK